MVAYVKHEGVWKKASNVLVKRNGVWTPTRSVWKRDVDSWDIQHNNEVRAAGTPYLQLDSFIGSNNTDKWRFFTVGTKLTDTVDNEDVDYILVKARRDEPATLATTGGAGYWEQAAPGTPKEHWSQFHFHSSAAEQSTTTTKSKAFPPGASTSNSTTLAGAHRWYVTAWPHSKRLNRFGSSATVSIWMPNNFSTPEDAYIKTARVLPSTIATQRTATAYVGNQWTEEVLTAGIPYESTGNTRILLAFGDRLRNFYGGGSSTWRSFQIYLYRHPEPHGSAGEANVNLWWTDKGWATGDGYGAATSIGKIGTLLPGQGKWFTISNDVIKSMARGGGRSFLISYPSSPTALVDQIRLSKPEFIPRQGEVHMDWVDLV